MYHIAIKLLSRVLITLEAHMPLFVHSVNYFLARETFEIK